MGTRSGPDRHISLDPAHCCCKCTWKPARRRQLSHCVTVHCGKATVLGCSNYPVPSGRDVKRLSIDLHAPGDGPKPNEGWRGGQ